jgi:prevent-host-death family protein
MIMEATKEVALRDANQQFASLIREVESGQEVIITRRGEAVAKLVPIPGRKRVLTPEQEAARQRMLERMEKGVDLGGYKFRREDAYEDI